MEEKNINKQCMEKILTHLTKLISLMEYEDTNTMHELVDMSTSISAQLIAIEKLENYIDDEEYEESEE